MEKIINQFFEIQQKTKSNEVTFLDRNVKRIFHEFENMGYIIKNPLGEQYNDNLSAIEATIVGTLKEGMTITKVMKPVIYKSDEGEIKLIQKGVVIVE